MSSVEPNSFCNQASQKGEVCVSPKPLLSAPPPEGAAPLPTRPGSWCERKGEEKAGERGGWVIPDPEGGSWDFTMG